MTKAIVQTEVGGPETMKWQDVELGSPGRGEAKVRHTAVGLNFIDVYFRTGLYPAPLPLTTGMEAAGVIEELGEGVTDFKVGDRVAYAGRPVGAYSEARIMPVDNLIVLPDSIDDKTGAAMMLQGMTTEYLLQRTFHVKQGDTILFHAAAGGVGLFACQWARHIGATVIGTVGSEEKAELAKAHGCTHTILYREEDFQKRVMDITDGKGVPVVYDAIGKDTFEKSLDCLSPRGLMVSFGNSSGPVTGVDLAILGAKGSLYVTRPSLMVYNATRKELEKSAGDLMKLVGDGTIKVNIGQTYPLSEARKAHEDLEGRKTTGSTVFTV
ncbi:quinone oxidoreductase [uncultured Sneathiella sp.]|jgi:NADPH2:quinone reductase|uniref:quinone oxidoreductase family protein n=1 Tax=uncultured Sneathiella sp. TaxID=879315 RepID=UPI0030DB7A3C|tara:strand:+ start:3659 stop:4633 length:975 start_codon:yes stop_codon:yes gene_type:complete